MGARLAMLAAFGWPVSEITNFGNLPKIKTMMVGDQTLAGDMNFDPLMIADSPEKLAWYREAEVKHARLAMLAAFGWPVAEIMNGRVAMLAITAYALEEAITKAPIFPISLFK